MSGLKRRVQVHTTFTVLWNGEIGHFTRHALNNANPMWYVRGA